MSELAKSVLQCCAHVVEGDDRKDAILSALRAPATAVLLPYDRDHNNEPCSRQGAKAHWAVLTGERVTSRPQKIAKCKISKQEIQREVYPVPGSVYKVANQTFDRLFASDIESCFKNVDSRSQIFETKHQQVLDRLPLESTDASVFAVWALQGKSKHMQLWNLEKLLLSNAQLRVAADSIRKQADQFILPKDGNIEPTLSNKIIVLTQISCL